MNLHESRESDQKGQRLRDQAKESFNNSAPPEQWHTLASQAVALDALANGVTHREYAASLAMRARLNQRYALAKGSPYDKDDIVESLRYALKVLRQPSQSPDQYEVNFAAIGAFAEATRLEGSRKEAFKLVGRSAWLAVCSESAYLARETNPELSISDRLKAKGRAFGRTAVATIGVALGSKALELGSLTRLMGRAL